MKRLIILFIFLTPLLPVFSQGMWMPNKLAQNEADMKAMGLQISIDQLYSTQHPSVKDAIAIFGRGCTSEIVSPNGLVFTNHHCGYESIQSVSTVEHNYLRDGFWAKSYEDEIPIEGLTMTFIDSFTDVTARVLEGVTDDMDESRRQSLVQKNINSVIANAPKEPYQTAEVKAFYKGNEYYLIIETIYRDIRFVGTPPESIGKFGADTDNWMWPRHTGDFSVFRVYAGPDNLPADYSPGNKPYKPKYYLPVSLDGVEEGDFTLVMGFPYTTDEYLPSYAVRIIQDITDPARYQIRDVALAVLDKEMRKDEATRLKYASKFAQIANYWKFALGESKGLKRFNAVGEKEKYEAEFTKRIRANKKWEEAYGNILPRLKELYAQSEDYKRLQLYNSELYRNADLPMTVMLIDRLAKIYENNGQEMYDRYKTGYIRYLKNRYEDLDLELDAKVFDALIHFLDKNMGREYLTPELQAELNSMKAGNIGQRLYNNSVLADPERLFALLEGDFGKMQKELKKDRLFRILTAQQKLMDEKVNRPLSKLDAEIQPLLRKYMKAQLEVFPEKKMFPDANASLRVAYGKVKGYYPRDAVYYQPFTHLKGVMEKYKPGDYEFDVPAKLIDLYRKKDYGPYGEGDTMPVCYLATNHITGGNSGSPVLDAHGNLIGLAFDGVWEGTMEDIYYNEEVCRSIMVDARYVLFVIDKVGGAKHIVDELKIVHPKK